MSDSISLTKIERLMLINQFEIRKKLEGDVSHYDPYIKALEDGYVAHYEDIIQYLSDDVPESLTKYVLSVLNLFDDLFLSFQALKDKDGINPEDITFRGFDGNHEVECLGYAQYFCHVLDRFNTIAPKGKSLNSHSPTREIYQRMLAAAASISGHTFGQFSAQDIKIVLNSRYVKRS